jgi:hypothetical protein
MKIATIRDDYHEASAKVSDLVRQLDFAGIGVVWIFTVGKDDVGIGFSFFLLLPLGSFVLSLAFDLVQYVYKSVLLEVLNSHFWAKFHDDEKDVSFSARWNWPTRACFYIKTGLVVIGYVLLLLFIFWRLIQHYVSTNDS